MQAGVNALGQIRGGTLEHLRQLLEHWTESIKSSGDTLILFASNGTIQRLGSIPGRVQIVPVLLGDWGGLFRVVAEQLLLPWLVWRHRVEVLFCPASTMPRFSAVPCVVMLQNAAPFLPARELRKFDFSVRFRMNVLRWFIGISVKRAAAIVFLSKTFKRLVASEIRKTRLLDVVLYHARPQLDQASNEQVTDLTRALGISRPYLLCVSHIYPYKNLIELIQGFGFLGTDDVQLVLVGQAIAQDNYLAKVQEAAEAASRFPGQVLLTGGLPHEQVQLLLTGCLAFVFPSTCENCPIGLIEALAHRIPIACSEVGVMPEIAGKAALLFDPYSPEKIAETLRTLILQSDVRAALAAQCEQELQRFGTPATVAGATWQVLSRVASSQG